MEDYLEAIYVLSRRRSKSRYVRISELSEYLGVSKPTALEMIKKLRDRELVKYERGLIELTEMGREIGERVWNRHRSIASFLQFLGVDPEIAERDACAVEHVLHPESFRKLKRLFNLLREASNEPVIRRILNDVRGEQDLARAARAGRGRQDLEGRS